ncbi:hypothetical protein JVX90_02235 [Gordonia sp. PDNC005]|uniref:hypothetical protein n=1 Tax=unclassified Gordonia (in: high G+C Gram-positive bacteria) TaxID=2657482 RepID=UPI001963F973|nr:hypothetical protein [Gordonia sp. PDNC005]QRY63084.1 hypothetical protein JVX90_02235 [Gordonia sp. PDNC005]
MTDLDDALAVYDAVGWESLDFADLRTAERCPTEHRATALRGLRKGTWIDFAETSSGSYGRVSLIGGRSASKLALFAITVGVDARRAVSVLEYNVPPDVLGRIVADRGAAYATEFVQRACVSSRRGLTHGPSGFGAAAIVAVELTSAEVPMNIEFLKDWAVHSNAAFTGDRTDFWSQAGLDVDVVAPRFGEYARAATAMNVPMTGPMRPALAAAVERGLLDSVVAQSLAFDGLESAVRPGDLAGWLGFLLDDLAVPSSEIADRAEQLIPLLTAGVPAVTDRVAPVLIGAVDDGLLPDVVSASLTAKPAKTRRIVVDALAARPVPSNSDDVLAELDALSGARQLAKPLAALATAWKVEAPVQESAASFAVWRLVPDVWDVPRFEPGPVSSEALTDLARKLLERGEATAADVVVEQFHACAASLGAQSPDAVRTALAGVPNAATAGLSVVRSWLDGDLAEVMAKYPQSWAPIIRRRDAELLLRNGELPCVLSQPSWDDLRVDPADLLARLGEYGGSGVAAAASDLALALLRMDVDAGPAVDFTGLDAKVVAFDGTVLERTAGQLAAAAFTQPVADPGLVSGRGWRRWTPGDIVAPDWLEEFEPIASEYGETAEFWVFPCWRGDTAMTPVAVLDEYHGNGPTLRQAARRRDPLAPGAAVNLLAAQRRFHPRDAADGQAAVYEAFDRGLLRPGAADVRYLDWADTPSSIAAFARTLSELAEGGLTAVVWPILDDLLAASAAEKRLLSGTETVVDVMATVLPVVQAAVAEGLADPSALDLPGLRTLADRTGSSVAVKGARALAVGLPAPSRSPEPTVVAPRFDLSDVWTDGVGSAPAVDDRASVAIDWFDPDAKSRELVITATFAHLPDRVFTIRKGWTYDIEQEGQCRASDGGLDVWLQWDGTGIAVRDNRDQASSGAKPPVTVVMTAVLLATLINETQDARWTVASCALDGVLHAEGVSLAMRLLLPHPVISPARMVRAIEHEPRSLPALWPILTESIRHAGDAVRAGGSIPKWANRVLDLAQTVAPQLDEAVSRGLAPADASIWPGLDALADAPGKSAAITKARALRDRSRV